MIKEIRKIAYLLITLSFTHGGIIYDDVNAQSPMIAEINEDVETDFGTYRPYSPTFTANVPIFAVESDFSNVTNFNWYPFGFTARDSMLLLDNHFTVKYSSFKQLYDIYNHCTWSYTPVFVTTDAVLHIYHVLFDQMLKEIEVSVLFSDVIKLTETLIEDIQIRYNEARKPECIEAARRDLAFLYVAEKLLKGTNTVVPEFVSALVDSELTMIEKHDGFYFSPIFGDFSKLDYSQFQPRGHYTQNDTLRAYFKAMMWYGWTIFTMEQTLFDDLAQRHTLQALLLVQSIYTLEIDGQPLFDLWENIYQPTVFFVGRTDDPNLMNYKTIAEDVFGENFLSLDFDSLADMSLLNNFMVEVQKLPEPKIPNWIYGTFTTYKGFRFMGQRFIPDSYLFAHLVDPYVNNRRFPKGLDIMAILGSDRAYTLLDSVYDETSYSNYSEKIDEFKTEFGAKPSTEWAQNLYWNWLYCLMPLLYKKGSGYPLFMQTLAWADRELLTALASWAELRHDTILYAKQSQSGWGGCDVIRSYVEPNPYLYGRLASLTQYTREGLDSRGLLFERFRDKLDLFQSLLLFLMDISIKELENIPLSESDYENIFCFGKVMQALVSEGFDSQDIRDFDTDDMAIIADVHTDTDPSVEKCLEEGVGYPLEIFVIVHEGGEIRITRGAIFSYYEFLQPITERLTDETWRQKLTDDTPPSLPEWIDSFMDVSATRDSDIFSR
jgi:hypothetical protein